jgi:transcriptional regulator with XRE-family HTH domain
LSGPLSELAATRKSKLLCQAALSVETGIHVNIISAIERGVRNPTEDQAQKLATFLGKRVDELFRVEGER